VGVLRLHPPDLHIVTWGSLASIPFRRWTLLGGNPSLFTVIRHPRDRLLDACSLVPLSQPMNLASPLAALLLLPRVPPNPPSPPAFLFFGCALIFFHTLKPALSYRAFPSGRTAITAFPKEKKRIIWTSVFSRAPELRSGAHPPFPPIAEGKEKKPAPYLFPEAPPIKDG
jgi:hypothetical protein